MISEARMEDSTAEIDIVGLRQLNQEEEVVVVGRLARVRVTPASADCEAGFAPRTREEKVEFERGVEEAVLKMVHGRRMGGLGELVSMVVGIGSTARAIEPRKASIQTL